MNSPTFTGKYLIPIVAVVLVSIPYLGGKYDDYREKHQYEKYIVSKNKIAEFEKSAYSIDMSKHSDVTVRLPISTLETYTPIGLETTTIEAKIKTRYKTKGRITSVDDLPEYKFNILCFGHIDNKFFGDHATSDLNCLKYYMQLAKVLNEKIGSRTMAVYYVSTNYRELLYSGNNSGVMASINSIGGARAFTHLLDTGSHSDPSYVINALIPFGKAEDIYEYYEYTFKKDMAALAEPPHNYPYYSKTGFTVIANSDFKVIKSYLFVDRYTEGLACESYNVGSYTHLKANSNPLLISRAIYDNLIGDGSDFLPDETAYTCHTNISNIKPQSYSGHIINRKSVAHIGKVMEMMKDSEKHKRHLLQTHKKVLNELLSD